MFDQPAWRGGVQGLLKSMVQVWQLQSMTICDGHQAAPHHVTGLPPSLSGGAHASVAVVWLAPRTDGGAGECGGVAAVVASSTGLFMPLPA